MQLNEQNFQTEIKNFSGIALVDFFATWCGPCRMLAPIIEELAEEYKNNPEVKIGKINVDENQALAEEYGVMSIPTLILFKNGQKIETIIGLRDKETLKELINKNK